MFAVINLKVKPGLKQPGPVTLAELRRQLGVGTPDINIVNADSAEVKYKIHG
jgi:hypothetical protein